LIGVSSGFFNMFYLTLADLLGPTSFERVEFSCRSEVMRAMIDRSKQAVLAQVNAA